MFLLSPLNLYIDKQTKKNNNATMEERILYVNTVKTTHVVLVISMYMTGKKGFSVTVVNSGFTENMLN